MSKRIITVFGATGVQGGSVVDALLNDAIAANTYVIRGVTRNPSSAAAEALRTRGVSTVQADLNDMSSLSAAVSGSYAIFAVTDFWGSFKELGQEKAAELETAQGVNIATAALSTLDTLQHFIFSTLPDASRITSGAVKVPHYESKAHVKEYIESQPELRAVTTFVWPGFYASNLSWDILKPVYLDTAGQYIQLQGINGDTPVYCLGDTRANFGVFIRAILTQKEKVGNGNIVFAYVEMITLGDLLQMWAQAHDVKAQYVHIEKAVYDTLWPGLGGEFVMGMEFWDWVKNKGSWMGDEGSVLNWRDLNIDVGALTSIEKAVSALLI
ncbi:hypothetical protein F5B22DRAFT_659857 [Xylaria bambusicola]|uniref:uncharacterized protein n=1 Tax=Xylaria bambusicola TaxID=326684 RepID=UPI002008C785|nr:uncharacterized protein F5B22DRAFT_659857 [Xylaria bambusicola]KAI0506967.1 hypothetical protein F5B22DRAFT_659857 [Xylaria bambusicola]